MEDINTVLENKINFCTQSILLNDPGYLDRSGDLTTVEETNTLDFVTFENYFLGIPPSSADLRKGWFSVAYGPFRRFTGGNIEKEILYKTNPRLGAHLSIFGEDVALSEALVYIQDLYIQKLENKTKVDTLDYLIRFINESALLPHGNKIDEVDSKNVYFRDGNGNRI